MTRPGRALIPDAVYRTTSARPLVAVLAVTLLAACAAPAPAPDPAPREERAPVAVDASPEALLRRARGATARAAASLRLRAARAYADRDDLEGLAFALEAIDPARLDAADRWRLALLEGRLALARGEVARAEAALAGVPDARYASAFDARELVAVSRLRAEIHEAAERPLAAARERVFLDGLLPAAAQPANRRAIWRDLTLLDAPTLEAARRAARGETELRGWLELARIARDMHPTIEAQQRQVELWRRRWEDHPAGAALPGNLARLPELMAARPRHLALLLPLTGELAAAGKAIRDGFVAAQLEAARSGAYAPRLTVLDSAALGARAGYLRAVDGGAELVVGPLAKTAVDELAALERREVPILALNATRDGRAVPGLVQFALLPEDEGLQLAERLHADGLERVLLLSQAAPWAERIESSFRARFEALGGEIVERRAFASTGEVGEAVSAALLVSESEARARMVRRILGGAFEYEPRRRRDVDGVVALADPLHGGTLKPALEYYFAGDLPVYASSQIHEPDADTASGDSPLAGIRFCDMPWRLMALPARRRMEAAWPGMPASLSIFHAIGVDAWRLHARLGDPTGDAGPARFAGVTGDLGLTADGRVRRELAWAVMGEAGARPLPRVVGGR